MADWQSEEDIAKFQELSNGYEPQATGPLVGERQSSSALISEYAAADPIYQAKTAKLPQSYSQYRTCRGDGRCGWRAIAFAYFESLLKSGSKSIFLEEETRLKSLTNLMNIAGYDKWSYEDFADQTYDLLRKYMGKVGDPNAEALLTADFNDEGIQNCIITHFKVLASAWMKTHPDDYAPFVLPHTIEEYVGSYIIAHGQEIDHPGIAAITDVLLKPANIALDVIYLDLSEGDEVNVHQFSTSTGSAQGISLLYRPGHYDILYKREEPVLAQASRPSVNAQTYLQYGTYDEEPIVDVGVPDFLAMMPGMSMVPNQSNWMSSSYYPPTEPTYAPAPLPVQHHAPPPATAMTTPPYVPSAPVAQQHPLPPTTAQEFFVSTVPSTNSAIHQDLVSFASGSNFRASQHMYRQEVAGATSRGLEFQTAQFKNSHFNTSHFLNPDFHPEEWSPDNDYITPNNRNKHKPRG